MMDDLILECCKYRGTTLEIQEGANGASVVRVFCDTDAASIVLSQQATSVLRTWLTDRLKPTEPLLMPDLTTMSCKPESKKQCLERIAVQLLAGLTANPQAESCRLSAEEAADLSIMRAQALIKQLDALSIDE